MMASSFQHGFLGLSCVDGSSGFYMPNSDSRRTSPLHMVAPKSGAGFGPALLMSGARAALPERRREISEESNECIHATGPECSL